MATEQAYALVATAAGTIDGQARAVGEVANRIMWDGVTTIILPPNTETRADPTGALQIGAVTTV